MSNHENKTPFFLKAFFSVFVVFQVLTLTTCGLETFYYLEPPINNGYDVRYDSEGAEAYFSFTTNETGTNSSYGGDFIFLGTAVYYKIFNNLSLMENIQGSIDSVNTKSDISAAADTMMKSYSYRNLAYSSDGSVTSGRDPLIPYEGWNQHVYIRLNTPERRSSGIIPENEPAICYSEEYDVSTFIGTPRRNTGANNYRYGFEFTDDDRNNNPLPKDDDQDFYSSSSSDDNVWYVDMWAFSVGRDSSYSWSYSRLLHLGSISIKEEWYND